MVLPLEAAIFGGIGTQDGADGTVITGSAMAIMLVSSVNWYGVGSITASRSSVDAETSSATYALFIGVSFSSSEEISENLLVRASFM